MRVVGHGIDLVEVSRIGEMVREHGARFLERCFTAAEREYAEGQKRRDEHLAARFAAKEAVLKALGTGWRHGIAWTDVEIVRSGTGQPGVALHGVALEIAERAGVREWACSLSHTATHAVASAIALGGQDDAA